MKTGDAAKHFGVSNETIRRWIDRFEDYLSESARGVNRAQRVLGESDFIILATVRELSAQGLNSDEISTKLAEGYRVEDTSTANLGYGDGRLVPAAMVDQVIDGAELRIQLEQVKAERDKLLQLLEDSQKRETATRDKLDALTEKLSDLQYRLGQAEGELKLRQEQAQPKKRWWGGD